MGLIFKEQHFYPIPPNGERIYHKNDYTQYFTCLIIDLCPHETGIQFLYQCIKGILYWTHGKKSIRIYFNINKRLETIMILNCYDM